MLNSIIFRISDQMFLVRIVRDRIVFSIHVFSDWLNNICPEKYDLTNVSTMILPLKTSPVILR